MALPLPLPLPTPESMEEHFLGGEAQGGMAVSLWDQRSVALNFSLVQRRKLR